MSDKVEQSNAVVEFVEAKVEDKKKKKFRAFHDKLIRKKQAKYLSISFA